MTQPRATARRLGSRRASLEYLVFALALAGCAATAPPPNALRMSPAEPAPPAAGPSVRANLWRDEVVWVVDQGLGRFLQLVELEPSFEAGRFQGFRIVALREARFWQGVDLKPGDVVLRVNTLPIERETQAYDAFQSLKTAPELRVDYLRDGARRTLVYKILERPKHGG